MSKRILNLFMLIFGLIGLIGCIAVIVVAWSINARVNRATGKVFGVMGDSLAVGRQAMAKTQGRVEALQITADDIECPGNYDATYLVSDTAHRLLDSLPAEKRASLAEKAVEAQLEIQTAAARAAERHADSAEEMRQSIKHAKGASSTGHAFKLEQSGETATGGWKLTVWNEASHSTLFVALAAVIAIAVLLNMLRQ